jgi:uncharacterized surface protein with fasciclin (FAS1) repeats
MMFALQSLIGFLALQQTQATTQNLVQVAEGTPTLSTLVSALKAADLVNTLSGTGPYTVFAPSNAAFIVYNESGALTNLLKPEKKNMLVALLKHHVVGSTVMAASLKDFFNMTTLQNQKITGYQQGGKPKVSGATLVTADVQASNGIVHIVDKLIEPSEFYYGVGTLAPVDKTTRKRNNVTGFCDANCLKLKAQGTSTTVAKSSNVSNEKTVNKTQTTKKKNMTLSSTASTIGIAAAVVVALGLRAIQ